MARKRYNDELSKNSGSVGYSENALKALNRGTYGKEYGRQAQYRTSQEQTQQSKKLPVLEGMTRSPEWESSFSRKNYVDTDRARRNYAQNYTPLVKEDTTSNDENYVVKRDRYDKLMQNNRLASDIKLLAEVNYKNANTDATVSQEWADEYGAKKITGGYNKKQFIDTLSRRYGLTPAELNDMALTFHSDAYKAETADYGKKLEDIGQKHEVLGSAGSLIGTLGSGFEGMYNAGVGALTGDDRYLSNIFSTTKKAPREGVKQNIKTDFGKGAYDIGMGIADMAAGAAAGSAPVFLAGNTANEAQESALKRGSSVRKSSLYGAGAGVLDFVTNKVGLDKAKKLAVDSIKSSGVKKFLAQNAIAGLGEAGENVLQDLGQSFLDNIINGQNSELQASYADKVNNGMSESDAFKEVAKEYVAQLGFSGALGFGMGSAMQAGSTVLPKVPELVRNKMAASNLNAIDPRFQKVIADAMNVPEVKSAEKISDVSSEPSRSYIEELREELESAKPEQKAEMLVNGGYFDNMVEAGEAFRDGQLDAAVDDFLTRMERNGDPTPSKPTVDNNKYDKDLLKNQYNEDWEAMRKGTIQEYTGADDATTDKYYDALRRFVGGSRPTAEDTAIIDDYIEHAPTYNGQISRGMHFNVGDGEYDAFMSKVHEGDTVTLGKPSSWASDPETARLYSHMGDDNVDSVEIICNQNRTSTPIDFINGQGEDEVVSSSNASWTVLREQTVTRPNGARKTYLYVAETGDKTPPKNAITIPEEGEVEAIPQESVNVPIETEPVATDNMKQSRVVTRTGINADIISQEQYDTNPIYKELASYAEHSNDKTYDAAMQNVKSGGDKLLNEYLDGNRKIDNDLDVDQSMLLLTNMSKQLNELGDNAPEDLLSKRNLLFSRLKQSGTQYGQFIQAFAKWNETPEGAIINGNGILDSSTKAWESQNQEKVKANQDIADALDAVDTIEYGQISNGGGGKPRKAKNPNEATSSRLDKALQRQGYDGTMEAEPKAPKTHEQHRIEVENSIRKEFGSIADNFSNNDFEYLTSLVENKVPVDIIADEIEHRLNHGEWYTIDESTPVKKAKSSKLASILNGMGDESRKAKNAKPDTGYPKKSHATIADEVTNTLEGEFAGLGLDTPTDIEFMTIMLEEGVPSWQIEDEINHRLMTGEWYSLDESIEEPKKMDMTIRNALNSLVEPQEAPVKEELSYEELRDRIKYTLDNEPASAGIFSDEDVDYIARLKQNGATKHELAQALNTKMATGKFGLSNEAQQEVTALFNYADKFDPNSQEACEAKAAAYKRIADEVVGDASPFEKFEAWRYLAMLGNPKTMLRNFVGNSMFNGVTSVSNTLSAAIEGAIDATSRKFGGNGIQRTKAILNPVNDADLIKGAWEDAPAKRYKQLQGSKYEKSGIRDKISAEKSVFNNKLLKLYEQAVDKGISDYGAIRTKYSTSLAGWMKANGLDADAFGAEGKYERLKNLSMTKVLTNAERAEMDSLKQTMDALEKGRDYALKQAEYATFHEDNAIAQFLTKHSQDWMNSENPFARAFGYMTEGVIPFKKTPANILRSGFEYSPLGAIKSIVDTGKLIYENTGKRKNNLGDTYTKKSWWRGDESEVNRSLASDVIDSWSKTLTGTGLAALGYYLKSKGVLNSSESDEKYQDDLEGIQNYSITINGKTYTIDWAAPGVMPLLLGAEISKINTRNAQEDKHFYDNIDEIIGSANAILDPIFETSMMQGVQNVLESAANEIKYSDDGAFGGIMGALATNALTGYMTQALPTVSGQISRTIDNTRRSTDTASDSNFLGGVEKQGRKLLNKTPLSFLNKPYVDAYGREQTNSPSNNPLANLAYQMLSPAYIREINTTDADKLSREVYNATGVNGKPIKNQNALPTWKSKVKLGDGTKLNPDQMYTYRTESGRASYAIRDALSKEPWFEKLSGEEQNEIMTKVKTVVNKIGLNAVGEVQTGKEYEAYEKGGVPALMELFKGKSENATIKKETNLSVTSNAAKMIKADMEAGNTQEAEQKIDEATQLSNLGFTKPNPTETYYKAKNLVPSLTVDEFAKTYKEIDADGNQGIKQDELISYFNNNHFTSEDEAMKVWNMYAPKGKKVPYLKKDGTWGKH